jgi:benzoate/toluate 1,2-dioxygenase alpha subunit
LFGAVTLGTCSKPTVRCCGVPPDQECPMRPEDLRWRVVDKPGETFKVHRSIYTDPDIFEAELKHI